MKITNLQCPSCGGKLEPMKNNPKIVVLLFLLWCVEHGL